MSRIVEEERERAARLCDDYSKYLIELADGVGDHLEYEAHGAEACSHLIVGRNEYGDEPDSQNFGDSYGARIAAIRSGDKG